MNIRKREIAGIIAPPPLIYLAGIGVGYGLERAFPTRPLPDGLARGIGIPLVVLGLILLAISIFQFLASKTSISPYQPSMRLITSGLYRVSRNPVYVADFFIYLGVSFWVNSAWILVMIVPTALLIQYGVVLREEGYLERKFGEEYAQYRRRVRRWA